VQSPQFARWRPALSLLGKATPGSRFSCSSTGWWSVEAGGNVLAELGPGAVVGECARLEGGLRTATLTAVTPIRVAEAVADQIDRSALERLSEGHRRQEGVPAGETPGSDLAAATVEPASSADTSLGSA
jgi:CRP-like cAMP-binding protein